MATAPGGGKKRKTPATVRDPPPASVRPAMPTTNPSGVLSAAALTADGKMSAAARSASAMPALGGGPPVAAAAAPTGNGRKVGSDTGGVAPMDTTSGAVAASSTAASASSSLSSSVGSRSVSVPVIGAAADPQMMRTMTRAAETLQRMYRGMQHVPPLPFSLNPSLTLACRSAPLLLLRLCSSQAISCGASSMVGCWTPRLHCARSFVRRTIRSSSPPMPMPVPARVLALALALVLALVRVLRRVHPTPPPRLQHRQRPRHRHRHRHRHRVGLQCRLRRHTRWSAPTRPLPAAPSTIPTEKRSL
jgi:hypothetical protein